MTTSAISLLMLALSLLTAVQQNPQLPPAFREQAVAISLQAIAEANKEVVKQTQAAPAKSAQSPSYPEYRPSGGEYRCVVCDEYDNR